MKICFPVEEDHGIKSKVYEHFGSAPGFVMLDTETDELNFIDNRDLNHQHGACNPAKALSGRSVDAVVVGGIGRGAIMRLAADGIKVAKASSGVISEDAASFKEGRLEMLSEDMKTCSHGTHDCSH